MPESEWQTERLRNATFTIARELDLADRNRHYARHHRRLFEERISRAEALARGLGHQGFAFGAIEWWFDEEDRFCWRRLETPELDCWEQEQLPEFEMESAPEPLQATFWG
jgi:hypothetical protein